MRLAHARSTLDEHSKWRNGGSGSKVDEDNDENNLLGGK